MDNMDTREWLLTNGLGSFACGTISDAHTRTYHGWLFAALEPPRRRTLLLSHIDASLIVADQAFELSTNVWASGAIAPDGYTRLRSFTLDPVPTWIWAGDQWQLTRQLFMPYSVMASGDPAPHWSNRILIRYCYEGPTAVQLKLRPLIGDRYFHYQQKAQVDLQFSQLIEANHLLLQAQRPNWIGTPWQLSWTDGTYFPNDLWYWNYRYLEETRRGLSDTEDLYSPGYLLTTLEPGDSITLEARVRSPEPVQSPTELTHQTFDLAIQAEQQRFDNQFACLLGNGSASKADNLLWQTLLRAGDQFIVYRTSIQAPTIMAGYPWFEDWTRDALIALPGLALTTQRFELARSLLHHFGQHCQNGLLPNTFPDAGARPYYNSLDAALWWIETLGLYVEATQDWAFLQQQYPVAQRIYKSLMAGTAHNIRVDAFDGLITWDSTGVALTWMDTVIEGKPITPRRGKTIEINALWYSALCWMVRWTTQLSHLPEADQAKLSKHAHRYSQQADQIKSSLQLFWNSSLTYLYDVIEPDDRPDPSIRPNAILALSLYHCAFPSTQGQRVVQVARDRLLTPYGLRSLDPSDPAYVGRYSGGMWERDRAYHQGIAWSWLLGPFIRAWMRFYPSEPLPLEKQPLLHHLEQQAGLGSISEIFDGDPPYYPRGAIAQAWSVAELIRHWSDIMTLPT